MREYGKIRFNKNSYSRIFYMVRSVNFQHKYFLILYREIPYIEMKDGTLYWDLGIKQF